MRVLVVTSGERDAFCAEAPGAHVHLPHSPSGLISYHLRQPDFKEQRGKGSCCLHPGHKQLLRSGLGEGKMNKQAPWGSKGVVSTMYFLCLEDTSVSGERKTHLCPLGDWLRDKHRCIWP